jgi:hypothetical protein
VKPVLRCLYIERVICTRMRRCLPLLLLSLPSLLTGAARAALLGCDTSPQFRNLAPAGSLQDLQFYKSALPPACILSLLVNNTADGCLNPEAAPPPPPPQPPSAFPMFGLSAVLSGYTVSLFGEAQASQLATGLASLANVPSSQVGGLCFAPSGPQMGAGGSSAPLNPRPLRFLGIALAQLARAGVQGGGGALAALAQLARAPSSARPLKPPPFNPKGLKGEIKPYPPQVLVFPTAMSSGFDAVTVSARYVVKK